MPRRLNRRALMLSAVAVAALPKRVIAQVGRRYRFGFLTLGNQATARVPLDAVKDGLKQLGYVEGLHYQIEPRYAQGRVELLDQLAGDLVGLGVDIVLTQTTPAAAAAIRTTASLPIVVIASGDLVAAKIVESLARPGGNVTGLSFLGTELAEKQMDFLKSMVPQAGHIGLLASQAFLPELAFFDRMRRASPQLGVSVSFIETGSPADYDAAFGSLAAAKVDALVVASGNLNFTNWTDIIGIAAKLSIPAIYPTREAVGAGGLVSYGIDRSDFYRRAADYVDRILRGARPGDLSIRQPTQFVLAVNLKTARALGVSVSQSILVQADEIVD